METAPSGAVRSTLYTKGKDFPVRHDLLLSNAVALRRIGEAYGEGQTKYGTCNWMKGFAQSVYLNHALEHLINYASGDRSEDHLAHAAWNLNSLMWVEHHKPELLDLDQAMAEVCRPSATSGTPSTQSTTSEG
jgi:hypothetical protein